MTPKRKLLVTKKNKTPAKNGKKWLQLSARQFYFGCKMNKLVTFECLLCIALGWPEHVLYVVTITIVCPELCMWVSQNHYCVPRTMYVGSTYVPYASTYVFHLVNVWWLCVDAITWFMKNDLVNELLCILLVHVFAHIIGVLTQWFHVWWLHCPKW
jgi:hypothetical protein